MKIDIEFDMQLDGFARKLFETPEDVLMEDGLRKAAEKTKEMVKENFDTVGHGAWPMTQKGTAPLQGGTLRDSATDGASVTLEEDGFEMVPSGDTTVADIQHERYGFYELTEEAQNQIAQAMMAGLLED